MKGNVQVRSRRASRSEARSIHAYLDAVWIGLLAAGQSTNVTCIQGGDPVDVTFYTDQEDTTRRLAALLADDLRHLVPRRHIRITTRQEGAA